ncbi:MAG: LamG domain-containing protein, partial [Planctomycetota bacterium]
QTGVPSTINAGDWHQIVGTYDGSALRCYLDGVLESTTGLSGAIDDDGLPLHIGADDSGHYFDGRVDDVAIFDEGLSDGGVGLGEPAAPGSGVDTLFREGPGGFISDEAPVPEPAGLGLIGLATLSVAFRRRRRRDRGLQ